MYLQHGKNCRDCSAAEPWLCSRFELEQQQNRREPDSGAADFYPRYLGDWVRRVETAAWATEIKTDIERKASVIRGGTEIWREEKRGVEKREGEERGRSAENWQMQRQRGFCLFRKGLSL